MIKAATAYAEGYQDQELGYYAENPMPSSINEAVMILAAHFNDSGSNGGLPDFAAISPANPTMRTVNSLLRMP
jgi:hypothetical protein